MKVRQKNISCLELAPGTKFFSSEGNGGSTSELRKGTSLFMTMKKNKVASTKWGKIFLACEPVIDIQDEQSSSASACLTGASPRQTTYHPYDGLLKEISKMGLSDPVDMIKCLQERPVGGFWMQWTTEVH